MSRFVLAACLIVALFAVARAAPAIAEDRLALVIGNAGYRNVPALDNPVNDAALMARTLRAKGFQVTMVVEADRAAMRRAVERFGRDLRAAEPGALAMFYFAGHGVRSDGFNYLVPLNVDIRAEADIAREAVSAEWVLDRIEAPGVTSVMVLDACRNNPFDGRGPGTIPELGDGLARMTAEGGNLIAYATGPGDVVLDGTGDNSPYTAALARAIRTPGLNVEEIFVKVREEVETATGGLQVPWESSSLPGAVYIQPDPASALPTGAPDGDPEEALRLILSVSFRTNREALGCGTLYRYDPVSLPMGAGGTRRVASTNGDRRVALELTTEQRAEGIALRILPVATGAAGRPITALLAEITPGREHAIFSRSRHPDRFGCGSMIVSVRRDG
ncbi:MAG: caspase family protein [Pseudomonadota bacterium]